VLSSLRDSSVNQAHGMLSPGSSSCKMAPSPLKHREIAREGGWLRIQLLSAQMTGLAEQHMGIM